MDEQNEQKYYCQCMPPAEAFPREAQNGSMFVGCPNYSPDGVRGEDYCNYFKRLSKPTRKRQRDGAGAVDNTRVEQTFTMVMDLRTKLESMAVLMHNISARLAQVLDAQEAPH